MHVSEGTSSSGTGFLRCSACRTVFHPTCFAPDGMEQLSEVPACHSFNGTTDRGACTLIIMTACRTCQAMHHTPCEYFFCSYLTLSLTTDASLVSSISRYATLHTTLTGLRTHYHILFPYPSSPLLSPHPHPLSLISFPCPSSSSWSLHIEHCTLRDGLHV